MLGQVGDDMLALMLGAPLHQGLLPEDLADGPPQPLAPVQHHQQAQAVDAVLPGVGLEGLKPASILAGPEGIEPPTRGLGVPCSIH